MEVPAIPQTALDASRPWFAFRFIFFVFCWECIFSVANRSVALATRSAKLAWIAGFVVVAVVSLCFRFRDGVMAWLNRWIARFPLGTRAWFWACLILGVLTRAGWAVMYQSALKSDGGAYFYNASTLATSHVIHGSFWPPGLPLFEAPFLMLLGVHAWVTDITTLLLFVGTYLLTYRLGDRLGGRSTAGAAAAVLAGWPTLIALTPTNCKECLLLFLVTAIVYTHVLGVVSAGRRRWLFFALGGLLIGFAALTQPGFNMFPVASLCMLLLCGIRRTRALVAFVLITASMLVAIAPWTIRNYLVFHRMLLISTNGGSVFYAANNPNANGDYVPDDPRVIPADQFAADKAGYQAGMDWIRHHPVGFASLAVRRQVNFLGDDGIGPYESMKRELNPTRRFYGLAKGICNLTWMAAWLLILMNASRIFNRRRWALWFGLCFVPILYQFLIDSVFVSGGRHHVCYTGLLAVLLGSALAPNRLTGEARERDPVVALDSVPALICAAGPASPAY